MGVRRVTRSSLWSVAAAVLSFLACGGTGVLAQGGKAPDVRTRVDRPAMWIGDHLTFTIDLTCAAGTDILVEDLASDKIQLEGLEMAGSTTTRTTTPNGSTRYQFDYEVSGYRVNVPLVRIVPPSVRYYASRAGQRPADAAPLGSVQPPPVNISLRSLLPDDPSTAVIRDGRAVAPRANLYGAMMPLGLGAVLASLTPLLILVFPILKRYGTHRRARARQSQRQVRESLHDVLTKMRSQDPATVEATREAFGRLELLVRAYLQETFGAPSQSLTAEEIPEALGSRLGPAATDSLVDFLRLCEVERYAPDTRPDSAAWRDAILTAERLLANAG